MYIGRYQLGTFVPITVLCRVSDGGQPAALTDVDLVVCKQGASHNDPVTKVLNVEISDLDSQNQDGLYAKKLFLDDTFEVGETYIAQVRPPGVAGRRFVDVVFSVVPGGDVDGSVTSMAVFRRPEATYVLAQVDSGKILYGRNPTLPLGDRRF